MALPEEYSRSIEQWATPQSKPQPSLFQTGQIVYLEQGNDRVFAEVVQVLEQRQTCWARPLMLAVEATCNLAMQGWTENSSAQNDSAQVEWYDLRNGADLLLPLSLFHIALDVEVIPLLTCLYAKDALRSESFSSQSSSSDLLHSESLAWIARKRLHQFVQRICQAHPEAFQMPSVEGT